MKSIVLQDFFKVELCEAPIPQPGKGQAVIRLKYVGICGSDLHLFAGQNPAAKVPLVMGHEGWGELYAINDPESDFKVGDKVCSHTVAPCYNCEACANGRENLCDHVKIMGTNLDGMFTQYLMVDTKRLIKFNDDVDPKVAALVEPLTVGVHDVLRSGLKGGDDVFIAGAGPIGLIMAMTAQYFGAANIILGEIDPVRIQMAADFGFQAVNPKDEHFASICAKVTNGRGFDRVFEITSVQAGFDMCVAQLKRGGVMVQVGMPPAGTVMGVDINKIIFSECELRGVRHHTMASMQRAAKIINAGTLNHQLEKLVSKIYPMEESAQAFEVAKSDKTMLRVLLDMR